MLSELLTKIKLPSPRIVGVISLWRMYSIFHAKRLQYSTNFFRLISHSACLKIVFDHNHMSTSYAVNWRSATTGRAKFLSVRLLLTTTGRIRVSSRLPEHELPDTARYMQEYPCPSVGMEVFAAFAPTLRNLGCGTHPFPIFGSQETVP